MVEKDDSKMEFEVENWVRLATVDACGILYGARQWGKPVPQIHKRVPRGEHKTF